MSALCVLYCTSQIFICSIASKHAGCVSCDVSRKVGRTHPRTCPSNVSDGVSYLGSTDIFSSRDMWYYSVLFFSTLLFQRNAGLLYTKKEERENIASHVAIQAHSQCAWWIVLPASWVRQKQGSLSNTNLLPVIEPPLTSRNEAALARNASQRHLAQHIRFVALHRPARHAPDVVVFLFRKTHVTWPHSDRTHSRPGFCLGQTTTRTRTRCVSMVAGQKSDAFPI